MCFYNKLDAIRRLSKHLSPRMRRIAHFMLLQPQMILPWLGMTTLIRVFLVYHCWSFEDIVPWWIINWWFITMMAFGTTYMVYYTLIMPTLYMIYKALILNHNTSCERGDIKIDPVPSVPCTTIEANAMYDLRMMNRFTCYWGAAGIICFTICDLCALYWNRHIINLTAMLQAMHFVTMYSNTRRTNREASDRLLHHLALPVNSNV